MHKLYVLDIIEKCNGKLIIGSDSTILDNFSIDTRTINKNDVYVGIKGEHNDGSIFYKDALENGAKGCILNETKIDENFLQKYQDRFIVIVKDTIECIQSLAVLKRSYYDIPVVGITGSVGKTSTKDIIASVLSQKYNVLSTIGNYNNHIGLPLTILRLKDEEVLVVEMGMNNLGEISTLSKIAKPTISVITNVGTSHIGNLGSRENILKAKLEILDGMDNNGILIINNDNDLLHKYYLSNNYKNIITYGIENDSNYMAKKIKYNNLDSTFNTLIDNIEYNFKINIPGNVFIYNALAGISIGNIFNIDIFDIKNSIENFSLTSRRMEIENIKNITIIKDFYNANLDSMNNAINYLGTLKNTKIAVLGDMLDLGDYSEKLHREIAHTIKNNNIDIVITVGAYSKCIKDELDKLNFHNNVFCFDNNDDAFNKLKEILKDNDNILIKASNGMNFSEIYNKLINLLK